MFEKNDENGVKSEDIYGQEKSNTEEKKINNLLNYANPNIILVQQNNDSNVQTSNKGNDQHSNNNNPQSPNNNPKLQNNNRIVQPPN